MPLWFILLSFFLAYSQLSQVKCLPYFHTRVAQKDCVHGCSYDWQCIHMQQNGWRYQHVWLDCGWCTESLVYGRPI